jgi:hypothetical protein
MTMNSEACPTLTEGECRQWLARLITEAQRSAFPGTEWIRELLSFQEAGLLTSTEGLVLTLTNGTEFQLSVKRSR